MEDKPDPHFISRTFYNLKKQSHSLDDNIYSVEKELNHTAGLLYGLYGSEHIEKSIDMVTTVLENVNKICEDLEEGCRQDEEDFQLLNENVNNANKYIKDMTLFEDEVIKFLSENKLIDLTIEDGTNDQTQDMSQNPPTEDRP